jgi:MFS family permease
MLVGSTLVILIVAGAINGLLYVLSLYFQDPAGLDLSPLQAGFATLPAAAGMVLIAPFVSALASRIGSRAVIALGFTVATAGFAILVFLTGSWAYGMFVLPLVAIAVGLGLSNGCASSAATVSVPQHQVGSASGVSNMARYVGAALFTAATATIYGSAGGGDGLARGVARCALLMTVASLVGLALAVLYGRHRLPRAQAVDRAAAAAGVVHTVPGSRPAAAAHTPG